MNRPVALFAACMMVSGAALALDNDTAREEMPGQDANLTADMVHTSPTEQPPIPTGPSNYVGDAERPSSEASEGVEAVAVQKMDADSKAEIEVFVPKPKRYVWKDEQGSGSSGESSSGGSSLSDKLNKISGGGSGAGNSGNAYE